MNAAQFKEALKAADLTYSRFAALVGTTEANVKMRLKRESIPIGWFDVIRSQKVTAEPLPASKVTDSARKVTESPPVAPQEGNTRSEGNTEGNTATEPPPEPLPDLFGADGALLTVILPCPDPEEPQFDIMSDGYPRGYRNDRFIERYSFRTTAALIPHGIEQPPYAHFKIGADGKTYDILEEQTV